MFVSCQRRCGPRSWSSSRVRGIVSGAAMSGSDVRIGFRAVQGVQIRFAESDSPTSPASY
jgi:hypothetical protein